MYNTLTNTLYPINVWLQLRRNETITTILGNVKDLKCTCKYAWLQKLLKEFSNLVVQDISCSDGVQLIHQEWELLNCTEFDCGDCVCRQNGRSAYANCSSGLTRNIPMVKKLSHIYAATNRIESLDANLFSDTLFVSFIIYTTITITERITELWIFPNIVWQTCFMWLVDIAFRFLRARWEGEPI